MKLKLYKSKVTFSLVATAILKDFIKKKSGKPSLKKSQCFQGTVLSKNDTIFTGNVYQKQ